MMNFLNLAVDARDEYTANKSSKKTLFDHFYKKKDHPICQFLKKRPRVQISTKLVQISTKKVPNNTKRYQKINSTKHQKKIWH